MLTEATLANLAHDCWVLVGGIVAGLLVGAIVGFSISERMYGRKR